MTSISIIKLIPYKCEVRKFATNCIDDYDFVVDLHELYEKLNDFFCKKCFFKKLDQCKLLEKPKFKRCNKKK